MLNRKNHKKGNVNHTNIDIQAMLVWLSLPFYDFCGSRSVAVNSVYKLQFLHLLLLEAVPLELPVVEFAFSSSVFFSGQHYRSPNFREHIQCHIMTFKRMALFA